MPTGEFSHASRRNRSSCRSADRQKARDVTLADANPRGQAVLHRSYGRAPVTQIFKPRNKLTSCNIWLKKRWPQHPNIDDDSLRSRLSQLLPQEENLFALRIKGSGERDNPPRIPGHIPGDISREYRDYFATTLRTAFIVFQWPGKVHTMTYWPGVAGALNSNLVVFLGSRTGAANRICGIFGT